VSDVGKKRKAKAEARETKRKTEKNEKIIFF
jgi:hypothetical protein